MPAAAELIFRGIQAVSLPNDGTAMKLIVEKWNIPRRAWLPHGVREVAVKVTPKRIKIIDGLYRGRQFDRSGREVSARYPGEQFRYRIEIPLEDDSVL